MTRWILVVVFKRKGRVLSRKFINLLLLRIFFKCSRLNICYGRLNQSIRALISAQLKLKRRKTGKIMAINMEETKNFNLTWEIIYMDVVFIRLKMKAIFHLQRNWYNLIYLLCFKSEIFEISKVVRILDSSKDLESISQMSGFVINFAVPQPVYTKGLDKNNAKLLESQFFCIVRSSLIHSRGKHFSEFPNTIGWLFLFPDKAQKSSAIWARLWQNSREIRYRQWWQGKICQGSAVVFDDVLTRSFFGGRFWVWFFELFQGK